MMRITRGLRRRNGGDVGCLSVKNCAVARLCPSLKAWLGIHQRISDEYADTGQEMMPNYHRGLGVDECVLTLYTQLLPPF